jgi:prepilin-type N-terminal cleavage/methylation domain-containing protein
MKRLFGLTLIEVMIVIAIIGILTSIIVPIFNNKLDQDLPTHQGSQSKF